MIDGASVGLETIGDHSRGAVGAVLIGAAVVIADAMNLGFSLL
jgi:hypothetical protein